MLELSTSPRRLGPRSSTPARAHHRRRRPQAAAAVDPRRARRPLRRPGGSRDCAPSSTGATPAASPRWSAGAAAAASATSAPRVAIRTCPGAMPLSTCLGACPSATQHGSDDSTSPPLLGGTACCPGCRRRGSIRSSRAPTCTRRTCRARPCATDSRPSSRRSPAGTPAGRRSRSRRTLVAAAERVHAVLARQHAWTVGRRRLGRRRAGRVGAHRRAERRLASTSARCRCRRCRRLRSRRSCRSRGRCRRSPVASAGVVGVVAGVAGVAGVAAVGRGRRAGRRRRHIRRGVERVLVVGAGQAQARGQSDDRGTGHGGSRGAEHRKTGPAFPAAQYTLCVPLSATGVS